MAIISMLWKTLAKVAKLAIMIEEEMPIRKKNIVRYRQDSSSEESEDFDEKKNGNQRRKNEKITLKPLEEVGIIKIAITKGTL